jgi:hypothetical protein
MVQHDHRLRLHQLLPDHPGYPLVRSEERSSKNQHDRAYQSESDQFLYQVSNDQQIYDDKMRLLFIKLHSTSARTIARSNRRAEPTGQIGAPTPESVRVERPTSNTPPTQK